MNAIVIDWGIQQRFLLREINNNNNFSLQNLWKLNFSNLLKNTGLQIFAF